MRIKALAITGCLAAAIALPALAKNNDTNGTFRLLQDFRRAANDASQQAASLANYAATDEVDWVAHANSLTVVRDDVNRMGKMLAKLEEARPAATPEEQAAIDRAAGILPTMAANTTAALNYLNAHQRSFWAPAYRDPVRALAAEARKLSSTTKEAVRLEHG